MFIEAEVLNITSTSDSKGPDRVSGELVIFIVFDVCSHISFSSILDFLLKPRSGVQHY